MDRTLRTALLKLHGKDSLPSSQFSASQRQALDGFARQTGAVGCVRQGRGDVYRILKPALFTTHLTALSPHIEQPAAEHLPARARNIAHARDSKAGIHQHQLYYPALKAVGDGVCWQESERGLVLELSTLTRDFGAASLQITRDDGWHTDQPLWLVENQALFDSTTWMPQGSCASLLYYSGQLDGRLLAWLAQRPRASQVVMFPDYDGVGLSNFARLYAVLGDACELWLMPGWQDKLVRYGKQLLWQKTLPYLDNISTPLPENVQALMALMRLHALALEQETVWL